MKKNLAYGGVCVVAATGLMIAGRFLYGHPGPISHPGTETRRVLYYVDPMNPTHTSAGPGKAPCGMDMEPVYADAAASAEGHPPDALPPGAMRVTAERQQRFGIKTAVVERTSARAVLRLPGKVTIDETRLFRVNASVNGWITSVSGVGTGDRVKQSQVLATYYSPQLASTAQSLLYALNTRGRLQRNRQDAEVEKADQVQEDLHLQQFIDSLKNLGMEDAQIETMLTRRKQVRDIEVLAPADGYILARNISPGQRFERGTELFQIADLARVWILADVLNDEAEHLLPGLQVTVTAPRLSKKWVATVSGALPRFDPMGRRLQVRLEVDNPELALKPDMFVDLEVPVSLPEAVTIPADSVLDSGLQKTVFVEIGNGVFEPRVIEIGGRAGNLIQVGRGLEAGQRIVVSGKFLLDSESRMNLAAFSVACAPKLEGRKENEPNVAGSPTEARRDPVCGMSVQAGGAVLESRIGRLTYFFCSARCKRRFDNNPSAFPAQNQKVESEPAAKLKEE